MNLKAHNQKPVNKKPDNSSDVFNDHRLASYYFSYKNALRN